MQVSFANKQETGPHKTKVVTVILNTNRRTDTLACLESLAASDLDTDGDLVHEIIVLDNASTDGSVEAIQAGFPDVQILPLSENLGYAGNNNVGIRAALEQGADWVFVLNEDTLLDPHCLRRMVRHGESNAEIGIVGPMVYHLNPPGLIQTAGGMFGQNLLPYHSGQNELDRGQFPVPRQVDWVSGCSILVRREVVEQVGMLDERFFYYWEETEWCLRAGKAGWKVVNVPQAKLWHKGVQPDYDPSPSVTYYNTRNRFLMLAKHHAPLSAWTANLGRTLRPLLSWTFRPKWRSRRAHRDALWHGLVDFLRGHWGPMPANKG